MARLTEYSDKVVKKAEKYLLNYKEEGDKVPSIEGLACYLDISRETVYAWAAEKDRQEFSDIVNRLRTQKSRVLQNGGLSKEFDGRIASLLLGHEGYREKHDITSNDETIEQKSIVGGLNRVYGTDGQMSDDSEGGGSAEGTSK